MSKEEILSVLVFLLKENNLLREDESVCLDTRLDSDFGFDSITIIQFVLLIEEFYEMEFTDLELSLESICSVATIVEIIYKRINKLK